MSDSAKSCQLAVFRNHTTRIILTVILLAAHTAHATGTEVENGEEKRWIEQSVYVTTHSVSRTYSNGIGPEPPLSAMAMWIGLMSCFFLGILCWMWGSAIYKTEVFFVTHHARFQRWRMEEMVQTRYV